MPAIAMKSMRAMVLAQTLAVTVAVAAKLRVVIRLLQCTRHHCGHMKALVQALSMHGSDFRSVLLLKIGKCFFSFSVSVSFYCILVSLFI